MKYYLLTFNEDWADEHNVPALACFNEDEYNKWLEAPCGRKNLKYEEQLAVYKANEKINKDFWKALADAGYKNTGDIPKGSELEQLERDYRKNYKYGIYYPSKGHSFISAHLGNSGDCFEENYSDYLFNKELVKNCVNVFQVTFEFFRFFHKARLDNLSLCNVFEINKDDYYDDDDNQ